MTCNVTALEVVPNLAVMIVEPTATAFDCPQGLTVATAVAEDDQVTAEVRSKDPPSEYVPIAVNC